jgi:hypothetical protein
LDLFGLDAKATLFSLALLALIDEQNVVSCGTTPGSVHISPRNLLGSGECIIEELKVVYMGRNILAAVILSLSVGAWASAQATRPAVASAAATAAPATSGLGSNIPLNVRATAAFNEGQYAIALPLLKQVAADPSTDPQRVGSLQEEIKVCEKNIANGVTSLTPAQTAVATSAETRVPHKKPATGETLELAIKDLGNFDYDQEKGGNIPADIKGLTGSKLRLRGYMIPMDQAENISQFALVPSLFSCCFGQPPQVQHTIVVNCPKGKAVNYYQDEIIVEGNLTVEEKKDDGFIVSIFSMECSSVKPAPK